MNVRGYIFLMFLALFCAEPALAQMDDFDWSDFRQAGNSSGNKLTGDKYVFDINSNANYFYHEEWHSGSLMTRDGEIHAGVSLRYDALNDELVVYNDRVKGLFVADRYSVTGFTVEVPGYGTQTFRRMALSETGSRERFMEVLYEGNITLIRSSRIVQRKGHAYRNKLGHLDNRVYELQQVCFLVMPDQSLKRINPGRKSILGYFPDQKKQVRRLLRSYQADDYSLKGIPGIVRILDAEGYFN